MKKLRLGLDIDGTVTDPAAFVPALNKSFNKELVLEDLTSFDLTGILGISREEFGQWMKDHESEIYAKVELASHVKSILEKWQDQYELYYVTARGSYLESVTQDWFELNKLPYHHIELLGQHDKIEAVNTHRIDLFFEDKHDNAVEIATACSIPVILLDTPYNQGEDPDGVIRVKNWLEAEQWVLDWTKQFEHDAND
ncbi:5' nucleotidase, NT5C type [Alkalicoccobacillus murimartini]|uniref:Nucleotidase n=1 Tax=Alkalicoccobacillus murimartini TaxID=171685 RepID=A0ABT9YCX2_9BACI|nr:hypothetical protein [Alkalicoccobacillus murimartini]MDQ0205571.1 putative HAD superfamily protein [Alkalicoccobacillus murimartini]